MNSRTSDSCGFNFGFIGLERLEPRALFAAAPPSNVEQYLIELVNRARADPVAEAARYSIDLNEGLVAGTISAAPKPPLAVNPNLVDGARTHSQWQIDADVFSHTGNQDSSPGDRMSAAGYAFTGSWSWAENIGWSGSSGFPPDPTTTTASIHRNFFVDQGVIGRGHRINLMNASLREIGTGIVSGVFTQQNPTRNWNAVMVTEDFARNSGNSAGDSFLTGVAYTDAVVDDNFYTPGEGIGGATIQARRISDNATFTSTTYASGGYSLRLNPGTYQVTASGGSLAAPVVLSNVVISSQNVKADFTPDAMPPTVVSAVYDHEHGRVVVQFSEAILQSTLQPGDVKIQPQPSGTALTPSAYTYNSTNNTATFTFPSAFANGDYRISLLAGSLTDLTGSPLGSDYASNPFFVLAGDANRNRKVDIVDLNTLAANWQGAGKVFSQGDFNFDTKVDQVDLDILAGNWQRTPNGPSSGPVLSMPSLASLTSPPMNSISVATLGNAPTRRTPLRAIQLIQ